MGLYGPRLRLHYAVENCFSEMENRRNEGKLVINFDSAKSQALFNIVIPKTIKKEKIGRNIGEISYSKLESSGRLQSGSKDNLNGATLLEGQHIPTSNSTIGRGAYFMDYASV